jgi:hypothetical protein
MMRPGDRIILPTTTHSTARLSVAVLQTSTIATDSGGQTTTHRLEPGDIHRIDLNTSAPTVEVRLVHGSVIIGGVVSVASAGLR